MKLMQERFDEAKKTYKKIKNKQIKAFEEAGNSVSLKSFEDFLKEAWSNDHLNL